MPRIPMFQQQQGLPTSGGGVRVEPAEMLAEQVAVKRAGAAVVDFGETIAIRGHQIQADIDEKVALDAFGKFSAASDQKKIELSQVKGKLATATNEQDGSFALVRDAEVWHDDTAKAFAEKLDNDNQREKFAKFAASDRNQMLNFTASHIMQADKEYTQEVRGMWKQRVINEISLSNGNQEYIDNRIAAYQEVAGGLRLSPETVQRDIMEIQTHSIAKQKDAQLSAVIVDLKTRYAGDPEGALQEASSPEFIQKYGNETSGRVISNISADLRIQDEIYQKNYRKTADDFSARLTSGKLSESAIDASDLRPDDKEKWKSHLRARESYDRMEARARRSEGREIKRDQLEQRKEAQERVRIATQNAIRSEQITDESQIDAIVAGAGLTHTDNVAFKKMFDDQAGAKGQVNYYNMAVEQLDKTFGWDVKKDRSEDDTKKRNQYLATVDAYMRKGKLRTNDPGVLELMDKLLEKRQERTQPWNLPQWGVPTRLEEIVESGTFIKPEDLGFKTPKKTTRK